MASSILSRQLAAAATGISGLLAGLNIDRAFVQMPAWRIVGARRWAEYSQHADLSRNGMILYPLEGIGSAALSLAAAVSLRRDRRVSPETLLVAYSAALFGLGGRRHRSCCA